MTIVFLISTIVFLTGWVITHNKHVQTLKLLEEAQRNTYSTPIKELASNFRDFVEGVDGKISPEVEAAIKKLEQSEAPKVLPPANPAPKVESNGRPMLQGEMWDLFCEEFKQENFGDEAIELVKHWGKKFRFSIKQQVKITKALNFGDEKIALRKYFEKNHG